MVFKVKEIVVAPISVHHHAVVVLWVGLVMLVLYEEEAYNYTVL